MNEATYQRAADIADRLLAMGLPVVRFEAVADFIVIRFGGPRPQTVHAQAETATPEGIRAAYERPPPI